MMRKIKRAPRPEAEPLERRGDGVGASFGAPVRRLQRIQDECAILVKAHPVVREYCVGLCRCGRILHDADSDTFAVKRTHQRCELGARLLVGERLRLLAQRLHFISDSRFRVITKGRRLHHQHGASTLLPRHVRSSPSTDYILSCPDASNANTRFIALTRAMYPRTS